MEYDDYLVDIIETSLYHAVYFDGELSYWDDTPISVLNVSRLLRAQGGAKRYRIWYFSDQSPKYWDIPTEPFDHMDYWSDNGLLGCAAKKDEGRIEHNALAR